MTRRKFIAAISTLVFTGYVRGQSEDEVRALADKAADCIKREEAEALYALMSRNARAAYSKDQLLSFLQEVRNMYGQIESYEFKLWTAGANQVGDQWQRAATYWYSITTDRRAVGAFMQISVGIEDGQYGVLAYAVPHFLGGRVPPILQGSEKKGTT